MKLSLLTRCVALASLGLMLLSGCEFISPPDESPFVDSFTPSVTCETKAASVIDPTIFPACADDAHCIKKELVNAVNSKAATLLGDCPNNAEEYCVPDAFVLGGATYVPEACSSILGVEGRCISQVVPKVQDLGELLPQDSCLDYERCAPCFDPRTQKSTGACNATECDNPVAPPYQFPTCGNDLGSCVPLELVPEAQRAFLETNTCVGEEVCAPNRVLKKGPYTPCDGSLFFVGYAGSCLNSDILALPQENLLDTGNCTGAGDVCAPCMLFGNPTGAPGC